MIASVQKIFGMPSKKNERFIRGMPLSCENAFIVPFTEGSSYIGICLDDREPSDDESPLSVGLTGLTQALAASSVVCGSYVKPVVDGYASCEREEACGKALSNACASQWFKIVLFCL